MREIIKALDCKKQLAESIPDIAIDQYKSSLQGWMIAQAESTLKTDKELGGTNLGKETNISPDDHYSKKGVNGVIYVPLGSRPARRPLISSNKGIKVTGVTKASLLPIEKTPIHELRMPIIATGYVYDGATDGIYLKDNEITIARNEAGTVYYEGNTDGGDALKSATGKTNTVDAARTIIEEEIGKLTLEGAHTDK